MFGNHFEYNYRSGISETIEGDNGELMKDNNIRFSRYILSLQF